MQGKSLIAILFAVVCAAATLACAPPDLSSLGVRLDDADRIEVAPETCTKDLRTTSVELWAISQLGERTVLWRASGPATELHDVIVGEAPPGFREDKPLTAEIMEEKRDLVVAFERTNDVRVTSDFSVDELKQTEFYLGGRYAPEDDFADSAC